LSGIDANVHIGLNQAFSFIGTGAFTGAAQLRYENTFDAAGNVSGSIIYGNVDNVRGADFSIFVSSFPTPNANDFIP
jgi:serralysin